MRCFAGFPLRQTFQPRRTTPCPQKVIPAALDRERPRAGKGDVAPFKRDTGLPGLQHDLLLGQDMNLVVGTGHGHRLVGEDVHLIGMRLDRMAAGLGDALDPAAVAEPAGPFADGGGEGVAAGDVEVFLAGQVQVLPGEEQGTGRAGVADVGRAFLEDVRLSEAFGRIAEVAAAGFGLLRGLSTDTAGVFAILGRVDALDEFCLLGVGLERQGRLLLRGIGEGLGGL